MPSHGTALPILCSNFPKNISFNIIGPAKLAIDNFTFIPELISYSKLVKAVLSAKGPLSPLLIIHVAWRVTEWYTQVFVANVFASEPYLPDIQIQNSSDRRNMQFS